MNPAGQKRGKAVVSKSFTLTNKTGFHMRPAQIFVKAMSKYSSDINIHYNGKDVNGKSIMNIMAGGMKYKSNITVSCNGDDEEAMLFEAASIIESGFLEE